jgi:diguanylate cyclase (GGDEF)-like protein
MAAEFAVRTVRRRSYLLAVAGVALAGEGVWFSLTTSQGARPELWVLTALALVAALLSFVTVNPAGAVVVINPAVCFTFAILLSWRLAPAIAVHVAAVAVLTWRHGLPPIRGLLMVAQFAISSTAAFAVLLMTVPLTGPPHNRLRETLAIVAALAIWSALYVAFAYLTFWWLTPRLGAGVPAPASYALQFEGALTVLSPVIAIATGVYPLYAVFVLLPIYAVVRMARLSAERERALLLDSLTSLANRTMLNERFDHLAAIHRRLGARHPPGYLAILLLDLDRFKDVNNAVGHKVGDELLKTVAVRLTTIEAQDVLVARLGGDEFAVLTRVPSRWAARELARQAVEALREPVNLDGLRVYVTASIGAALSIGAASDDFTVVLRQAESAMYEAKRRGDAVASSDDQGDSDDPDQLHLLADFREALQNRDSDEIAMHYQPQVILETGEIEGLEALLRWTHPVHGAIQPGLILSVVEHTPVMNLLTGRVIDDVTAQISRWSRQGTTVRVAINVSARDLFSESIVERLRQRLEEHRLSPSLLQIEVTESGVMGDPEGQAGDMLRRIANLGVGISLDDFGTGFSSMAHLRHLPLSEIKIDRMFVGTMRRSRSDKAIVTSTIDMAHALGLRVVAEGIEDEPTREILADLGCDLGQGWHFSRAVAADLVPGLIRDIAAGGNPSSKRP